MNRTGLIIFPLMGLLAIGCEKDNHRSPEIRMGETCHMVIQYYDTTLAGGYNTPKGYSLDIDLDGIDDIEFISEIWGSPGLGQHPSSLVKCLHGEIQLFGRHTSDTLFLNRETYYQEGPDNSVEAYMYHNYTCYRIDQADSVLKVTPAFKITALERGDIIGADDTYNPDTISLQDDWYGFPPSLKGISGDTTFYECVVFFNDCYSFPAEEPAYIGIRSVSDESLGWIRISIFDKYKILVLESAMQEK
jgi:hypothetical protein